MNATTFLSVRMPETESRRVKVLAARLGLSLQEVVRQALDAWVLEHDPQARRRRERQTSSPASADRRAPQRQAGERTQAIRAPEVPGARAPASGAGAQPPNAPAAPQVAAAGHGPAEQPVPPRSARPRNLQWLRDAERLDWSQCRVVKVRATQAGRVWFFRGTHVTLPAVLHDFMNGCSLREVLTRHAGLTAEQAKAAVEFAYRRLVHTKNA